MRAVTLDVDADRDPITHDVIGESNAKTYAIKFEKEELGKNYTFQLKEGAIIHWQLKYEVAMTQDTALWDKTRSF